MNTNPVKKIRQKNGKYKILVELTNRCNLSCPYCYYQIDKSKYQDIDYDKLFSFLKRNRKKLDRVTLTGGEPLLYSKFNDLVCALAEMKIPYNINTNGTLITEEKANLISSGTLTSISISLDSSLSASHKNLRNYHNKAVQGLKILSRINKRKFTIRVVCVLSKINFKEANSIYESIARIKIDDFCFQPVYIPKKEKGLYDQLSLYNLNNEQKAVLFKELSNWAKNQRYDLYLDFLKQYMEKGSFCSNCKNTSSFWCNVDGDIYPCFIKVNNKIGNLASNIEDLYFSSKYQTHVEQANAMSCFSEKCFCAFLSGLKR